MLPTPAVLGATALVIAGGGAVIVSSSSADSGGDPYDPATSQLTAEPGATYARGGGVLDVSRSVDRETLQKQARMQARQLMRLRTQLAQQAEKHAAEVAANQWVLPLVGYTLSAGFGETSYLWSSYHTGQDFSAPEGTEIVSVAYGTVIETTYDSSYGNLVKVQLEDGTQIWYAHQSSYVVSEGEEVEAGQTIGYVGSTGNTTGPHLHLEVRLPDGTEDGDDVDPYEALIEHGVQP